MFLKHCIYQCVFKHCIYQGRIQGRVATIGHDTPNRDIGEAEGIVKHVVHFWQPGKSIIIRRNVLMGFLHFQRKRTVELSGTEEEEDKSEDEGKDEDGGEDEEEGKEEEKKAKKVLTCYLKCNFHISWNIIIYTQPFFT